jgi:methenyltetrahydromethanopterin cyclohydrolase
MTTKTSGTLEAKIEQMVREHLAAQQAGVKAAVERAFAVMAPAGKVAERQRASYSRRAPSEVAELAEKVLEAVQACPGETMTTIAARVGEKPRALHRPMRHLKEAGRVRSAGERNFTRYFPMTGKSA